jgi:hypothetical protein
VALLTNRRDGTSAVFGKIRLLGPAAPAAMHLTLAGPEPVHLPPLLPTIGGTAQRLVAGYYDRPLFPENFSATEALDAWSGRSLDDWQTFHEGASRLAEYLQYVGQNGLMINVLADGSAIYPSDLLQSTPRYDTGQFFANGQDPVRKDVLEMLLRIFDREGLKLIPAVQFAAPLPELEVLRRSGTTAAVGMEMIDAAEVWLRITIHSTQPCSKAC